MIADCPACAPAAAELRAPRRARAGLPWLALLPAILAALAPKCPMCLVAYLSAFGVSFGMASLALSVLRPLGVALGVLALGLALWRAKGSGLRLSARCHSAERRPPAAADGYAAVIGGAKSL
jgi:hypothetical protein